MTIAFRSKHENNAPGGSTTSVNNKPAGTAADDILLLFVYIEGTQALTYPGGFTEVAAINASNSSFALHVAWKRATGSEPSTYTTSWTGGSYADTVLCAYSGAITSGSPMDATPVTAALGSGATSIISPSITTVSANTMVISFVGDILGNALTKPAAMTLRSNFDDQGIADVLQAAAGASGTFSWAMAGSASQRNAVTLALTPAGSFNPTQTVPDVGSGADAQSSQAASTQAETGAGTDATFAQTQATIADSGAGGDTATQIALTTISDAGSGADVASAAGAASLGDGGTGSDAVSAGYGFVVADTASAIDASAGASASTLADAGSGADASVASYGFAVDDAGIGADNATPILFAIIGDSATGVDEVSVGGQDFAAVDDAGMGADVATGAALPSGSDAASGTDSAASLIIISVTDVATGVDHASTGGQLPIYNALAVLFQQRSPRASVAQQPSPHANLTPMTRQARLTKQAKPRAILTMQPKPIADVARA